MYSYFFGKIVEQNDDETVIDVHDIGYSFLHFKKDEFPLGQIMKVYLYHILKEDDEFLVGFCNKEERNVFEKLITVKGIGPKTALQALSATTIEGFYNAIETGNVKFLKSLPGIGVKAAGQIILDLKGKLVNNDDKNAFNKEQDDAILALRSLGFKIKEIEEVIKKLPDSLSCEELIRESLRRLKK